MVKFISILYSKGIGLAKFSNDAGTFVLNKDSLLDRITNLKHEDLDTTEEELALVELERA